MNDIEKKCSRCESDYSDKYFKSKYSNEIICQECLLELDGIEKSVAITNYFLNGEYLGNDEDTDELVESICNNTGYEEVKDDE